MSFQDLDSIIFQEIYFGYQEKPILKDFNCSIDPGSIWIVQGPSGCGKTTWLHLIAGLLKPQQGHLKRPVDPSLSLLFQDQALWPHLSVWEHLDLVLKSLVPSSKERCQKIESLLIFFDLSSLAKNFPEDLSGGERQRLALARALVTDPQILLLDEPFNHLDITWAKKIIDFLLSLPEMEKRFLICVTHGFENLWGPQAQKYHFTPSEIAAHDLC